MLHKLHFEKKIKSFEYDSDVSVLTIDFGSGIIKKFSNVPSQFYLNFSNSPDKDMFYKEKIEGKFCVV